MKPLVASKPELKSSEAVKGTVTARQENAIIRDAVDDGVAWMKEKLEPFCSACMWEKYNELKRLAEYQQGQSGKEYVAPEVPDWHDYAGKNKFQFLRRKEKRIRREGIISIEDNYQCLAKQHGVCMMTDKPYFEPGTPMYDKTIGLVQK